MPIGMLCCFSPYRYLFAAVFISIMLAFSYYPLNYVTQTTRRLLRRWNFRGTLWRGVGGGLLLNLSIGLLLQIIFRFPLDFWWRLSLEVPCGYYNDLRHIYFSGYVFWGGFGGLYGSSNHGKRTKKKFSRRFEQVFPLFYSLQLFLTLESFAYLLFLGIFVGLGLTLWKPTNGPSRFVMELDMEGDWLLAPLNLFTCAPYIWLLYSLMIGFLIHIFLSFFSKHFKSKAVDPIDDANPIISKKEVK